jgi:TRAP-type C4-dicarboxylate transport system permease small subunit
MKRNKIYFWIATVVIFLFEGIMPVSTLIFSPENFNAGTKPLGYPDYFAYALIVCKFLGATAIIIPNFSPKIKEWAYAGLTFNLVFAIISHAVVDGNIGYILTPVFVGVVLAISYINYHKIEKNG